MQLRFADERDTAACLAIYAQYIDTSSTFETALPSEADCSATMAVEAGLRTVGIQLLDHIIVAENDFTSMVSSGFLHGRH